MLRGSRAILTVFLLAAVCVCNAQKVNKKLGGQTYQLKPDQTADIDGPKLIIAKQSCENWGLAAGLESMLLQHGVALDQNFWVMRMNAGELCVPDLPSADVLAKLVDQEFKLEDGRKVRLQLQYTAGAPTDVDSVIARIQRNRLSLLLYRGHPYYVVGVTYDENIGRDGTRFFEIKELRLANTFAGLPGITFQKGRDDLAGIQGILILTVNPI
jgi:hypothetical protein